MGRWVFDDIASFGHMLLGAVAAKSMQGKEIAEVYTLYQLVSHDPSWMNKLGDFIEFGVGWAIGKEL